MSVAIVASSMSHQVLHADAMQEGLERHGILAPIVPEYVVPDAQTVICWGWRIGKPLHDGGKKVLVMERGYICREEFCSLGWNGLNGRASRPWRTLPHRVERFIPQFRPWNPHGQYVLLIGQVAGDAAVRHVILSDWYAEAVKECAKFGLPIKYRPHPVAIQFGQTKPVPGTQFIQGGLYEALDGAAVVVTFNSNVGVDALMAGKPTIARDDGSMAKGTAASDWEIQKQPDREQWARWLASIQFSVDELRSGYAWDVVTSSQTAH